MMWSGILFILAGIGSLLGAGAALFLSTGLRHKNSWRMLAGALVLFALAAAMLAYHTWQSDLETQDYLVAGVAAFLAAILASTGVYFAMKHAQEQNQSEEDARIGQGFYQSILDHLPHPVVYKDASLVYRAANAAFKNFLGKTDNDIIGRTDADFFPHSQAGAMSRIDEQTLQQGNEQIDDREVIGTGGKTWLRMTHIPVMDEAGAYTGLLVSCLDITDRKQLERKLEENKAQIKTLTSEKQSLQEEQRLMLERQTALLRFERLLVSIATHFIDSKPEKIDHDILGALRSIGTHTGSDRLRILLFSGNETELKIAYAWSTPNLAIHREPISAPSWIKLGQVQVIHIPGRQQVPPESSDIAEFMEEEEIQSFTAIPLISGRSVNGYLWLESIHNENHWDSDFLDLLKFAGSIFISALDRTRKEKEFAQIRDTMQRRLVSLEQQNRENSLLNELGDLLQVCRTMDEAYPIIARFTQQLIPVGSGALYLASGVGEPVDRVAVWGETPPGEAEVAESDCWALRRGRIHVVQNSETDLNCTHLKPTLPSSYMCTPLIAQGETIGLLHLRLSMEKPLEKTATDDYQRVSELLAENTALALSNLSLRDRLRSQAIRDPLTGLFNRRYMEETLEREIRRAIRHSFPVSVIMFDVDHLKQVNDTHGHDAGDIVLKALGNLMVKIFRGEDVACRYGGDEFTIVLPEATVSEAFRRAEQFREAVKKLEYETEGKRIQSVSVSVGISAYPDHGVSVEKLLQVADAASYAAKVQGRDRVMIGGTSEEILTD